MLAVSTGTAHTNPSQQTHHTSGSLTTLQRNQANGSQKMDHQKAGRLQKLSAGPGAAAGVSGTASQVYQYALDRSKSLMQSNHSGQTTGNITMSSINSQGPSGPGHQRQRSRKQSSGVRKVGQQPSSQEMYQQQRSSQSQSVNRLGSRHHQSQYDMQRKVSRDKDKALMAGTLSGMSCSNLSQHDASSNNDVNTSLQHQMMTKNKSTISFNHYLSHNNTKENTDPSHLQEEFSGPKSALVAAENLSQSCLDDSNSNDYYDGVDSQNNRSNLRNKSNSQLSINLDQVQINEQPPSAQLHKYPTMPGSRSCIKSLSHNNN